MAKIKPNSDDSNTSKLGVKNKERNKIVKPRTPRKPKISRPSTFRRSFKKQERGVVYLSHVPHGFYEEQLRGYFDQFGKITNVSVPRNEAGNARGYAFVEFRHPEVAQIAAETMNNYLMFNRVIKAKYIEPKDQKPSRFLVARQNERKQSTLMDRAKKNVEENRKQKNQMLKTTQEAKVVNKLLRRYRVQQKRAEMYGQTSQIEVNKGNIDSLLKRNKELIEERKRAEEEKKKKEEELRLAKEAAKQERIKLKKAKIAARRKKLRVYKLMKLKNPNFETLMDFKETEKNDENEKPKKSLKDVSVNINQSAENKSNEWEISTEKQTELQVKKKNRKSINLKGTKPNENVVESGLPVAVKPRKKRNRKPKQDPKSKSPNKMTDKIEESVEKSSSKSEQAVKDKKVNSRKTKAKLAKQDKIVVLNPALGVSESGVTKASNESGMNKAADIKQLLELVEKIPKKKKQKVAEKLLESDLSNLSSSVDLLRALGKSLRKPRNRRKNKI